MQVAFVGLLRTVLAPPIIFLRRAVAPDEGGAAGIVEVEHDPIPNPPITSETTA